MTLRLYNTMSGRKEEFMPLEPGNVKMYVCGVTVYDMCHIGHARSQIVFDTIYRYLMHKGYQVNYARNFTDIDDKIINRANETDTPWNQIASKFIDEFYTDMDALGVLRPTIEPKATDHIDQIIALVKQLVDNGVGYAVDGDVYFEVEKFEGYGKLSNRNIEDLKAGARVEIDDRKHSPMDFALWKASKPGEPSWESPWGPGRPGWHIECSAMSGKHLGETFDIHGGGKDLVFPHHENEIAQSEAATGKPFVRYWLHNGFVQINSEKMSKSLGNFFTIRDVLKVYPPEAVRLFIVSAHYRSPIDYSDKALFETMAALDRLYAAWEALVSEDLDSVGPDEEPDKKCKKINRQIDAIAELFEQSMDDDFNTAKAGGHLFELVRIINTVALWPDQKQGRGALLKKAGTLFEVFRNILGVPLRPPKQFRAAVKAQFLANSDLTEQSIEQLIAQREAARQAKDFAKADAVRNELLEKGVVLKDTRQGTTWDVKLGQ